MNLISQEYVWAIFTPKTKENTFYADLIVIKMTCCNAVSSKKA